MQKNIPSGMSAAAFGTEQLLSKLFDLAERSERNCTPTFSKFLRAEELAAFSAAFKSSPHRHNYTVYGGFEGAERCVVGFLPDYLIDSCKQSPADFFPVCAVKISGSGFKSLSHRDFLGAILSLGIERETVGDIYVFEERFAYAVLLETVTAYVAEELTSVGRDKVRCEIISPALLPTPEHEFEILSETVASLRLDAVLSAITNLSRDKAEKLIASGEVCVNHTQILEKSFVLCGGELLSVRGKGRFILESENGLSKKGRIRITVKRYI